MKLNIKKKLIFLKNIDKKSIKISLAIYSLSFGYLFILSEKIVFSLLFSLISFSFFPYVLKEINLKKQKKILLEFQDFLYIFNSNLKSGKSIGNSLAETVKILENIYFKESMLSAKIERIIYLNSIGISYEKGFYYLEEDFNLGYFKDFGNIIEIARKEGGGYLDILVETSNILGERLEIEREIQTLLAKQNMEIRILRIIPLVLLFVLKFIYPSLIIFLSTDLLGIGTFILVAFIMVAAIYISNKLMEVIW